LAAALLARLDLAAASFAWEGSSRPGAGHYYRIQAPGLLIEYNNTSHGADHPHTVWRQPAGDFGDDLLAAHPLRAGE
jgi:hypothetical protein